MSALELAPATYDAQLAERILRTLAHPEPGALLTAPVHRASIARWTSDSLYRQRTLALLARAAEAQHPGARIELQLIVLGHGIELYDLARGRAVLRNRAT